ncbi:MAG: hypothetical protein QG603_140 [Patescibacteria group bacterium]|nr:hypothetical protein [Patescibacteria group bacterium]MDQ5970363.1 hypothetical protein [Patescibacteria group bacterium]
MFKLIKKNNSGFALAMTLMILSLAMLTGLFMNRIIVGEVRVSLNTVNVVNSYYAAESGIERALYYITTDQLSNNNITYYDQLDTGLVTAPEPLANGATYVYSLTSTSSPNFLARNISNTNPAHVSIVDPQGEIGSISWSASSYLNANIRWKINNCFPANPAEGNHASDRLETTIYSFGSNFSNPKIQKVINVCDCKFDESIDSCTGLSFANISPNEYYKFTFRPLDGVVSLIDFSVSGGIFSETLTQVKGKYKNSEYLLQAKMSALQPASDIFSYVIFSEEDLTKD